MNPGIGAPELLVIAFIALIVVGPKDLPLMVRRIGQFMGRLRGMAREFQRSFDDLGREAELAQLRQDIQTLKESNPVNEVRQEIETVAAQAQKASDQERPHPRLAQKTNDQSKPSGDKTDQE